MGARQSRGNRADEPTRHPKSDVAIRLRGSSQERETLSRLRASLPALEPLDGASALGAARPTPGPETRGPETRGPETRDPETRDPETRDPETQVVREPPSRATPPTIVLPSTTHADRATLTMLRGPGVGTTFRLELEETVLGRGARADIVLDEASVSREHARVTRGEDGAYFIEDLGSTNGTFVAGRLVERARPLENGDRVQIGSENAFRFAILGEDEEMLQRKLYESSMRDPLTGLVNRGFLFEQLATASERARRDGSDVGVLIIDVDHFKSVNDRYGHAAGDEVLRAIALAGGHVLGESDVFARYGGEEFVVLTYPTTKDAATELAERFVSGVRELSVPVEGGDIGVTVSIGVALLSECGIVDPLELFARGDARLYAAKLTGRNRVCAVD